MCPAPDSIDLLGKILCNFPDIFLLINSLPNGIAYLICKSITLSAYFSHPCVLARKFSMEVFQSTDSCDVHRLAKLLLPGSSGMKLL